MTERPNQDAQFLQLSSFDMASVAGQQYRIIVAPPPGPIPEQGYPVIYVLDGNAWAPMVAEIIRTNLDYGLLRQVVPAVVVGIGYPTEQPFDMASRYRDLTTPTNKSPRYFASYYGEGGGLDAMFNFIQEAVQPAIEARFPIDVKRKTLVGHSLGGHFVLRALMDHATAFASFVALSPSIWFDDGAVLKDAQQFRSRHATSSPLVYIGVGNLEEYPTPAYEAKQHEYLRRMFAVPGATLNDHDKALYDELKRHLLNCRMVSNGSEMARVLAGHGLKVQFDCFPDEDHFSSVLPQLGRAISFALQQ